MKKIYYPTIQEFWSAVKQAKTAMDNPVYSFVEIRCVKGSEDEVLPYPPGHKFDFKIIDTAHYTLARTRSDRIWRTTALIAITHPSGMFRIKAGVGVVARPMAGAEIGFDAEDIEPYQEKMPVVRGLRH